MDKEKLAIEFGVECYQLFHSEGLFDGFTRVIDFAVAELGVDSVAILNSIDENYIERIRKYCVGKNIQLAVISSYEFNTNNCLLLCSHRCRNYGEYIKVKKLVKKCREVGGFIAIDVSDTFNCFSIDFKHLDIDACLLNNIVILSNNLLKKSYKYIGNKYFAN